MELSFNIPVNSEQGYPLQGGSVRDQIVILRSLDGAQTTDNTVGMSANSPRKTSQSKESPSPWLLSAREAEHTALLKTQAPPPICFLHAQLLSHCMGKSKLKIDTKLNHDPETALGNLENSKAQDKAFTWENMNPLKDVVTVENGRT